MILQLIKRDLLGFLTGKHATHKIVPLKNTVYNPTKKLDTIKLHRTTIETYKCPKCGSVNLKADSLEEGIEGWEAHVHCTRCSSNMTLNNTGFRIDFMENKQK